MAKRRDPLGPTDWSISQDGHSLMAWVHVEQNTGTYGMARVRSHYYREDEALKVMAKYRGQNKANDFPTLLRLLRQVLDAAEKVWQLEQERDSDSN